ncbi:hypothetical protein [Ekhidna sp.]|uniref:hypothetical protein n=1 Tax=Ekhidna sp. TaxID=2608089 RepID=UPI003C7A33D1
MRNKLFTTFLFILAIGATTASAQRIVVDSASTNKYLIRPEVKSEEPINTEEPTFGDRAFSIGKGIINRLKARLNLEEAAESIKGKKQKILGKPEDNNPANKGG